MNATTSPLVALVGVLCVAATAVPCLADTKDDFVSPPLKFRARPLWFWNNAAVTSSGVGDQLLGCRDRAGYGGLAPLPFGPKFTPKYLSGEYFELYGETVKQARELGMFITLYDEYGFPSGSAGANNGDGIPRFKDKHPAATLRRLDKHEDTVSGPAVYAKPLPAGFEYIELEPCTYMVFQGEPYDDEQFENAIVSIQAAIERYHPDTVGYRFDENAAPMYQLEPLG